MIETLNNKAKSLTESPGVYLMKDKLGKIIYIGKAKNLKKRVSSYFNNIDKHFIKVLNMTKSVNDFDYIVTNTELEALVLECNLIKRYKPKYNILLKDDKGYYYIKISNEEFPKITMQFNKKDDDNTYIGPYTSSFTVSQTVDQVNKIFKLPTCNRVFPKDFNKDRPCLNYHINQCVGVCTGKFSSSEIQHTIKQAINYIKKGSALSIESLSAEMDKASFNLDFEKAAKIRDKIRAIKKISEKQNVILGSPENLDSIAIAKYLDSSCISMLIFRNGRLIDKYEIYLTDITNVQETLREFILTYYTSKKYVPDTILINDQCDDLVLVNQYLYNLSSHKVNILIPNSGKFKPIIDMTYNNAIEKLSHIQNKYLEKEHILNELANLLGLTSIPRYIEAYDISNLKNSNIVAGMIVYENGKPNRKLYKRFSIKDLQSQDDYESMRQAISRRFKRYFNDKDTGTGFERLPDLILLDGGIGHVKCIKKELDKLSLNIPLFGLVKDSKHKTRAISGLCQEISISSNKIVFNFLAGIQEEVHRYAIAYQHLKNKKSAFQMELITIEGIGVKKAEKIIKYYKTKERILLADIEEISRIAKINSHTAQAIKDLLS